MAESNGFFHGYQTVSEALNGMPRSASPPRQAIQKPTPSPQKASEYSSFKGVVQTEDLNIKVGRVYNCVGNPSRLLLSEDKLTPVQLEEYSKRHDVLLVIERTLPGKVKKGSPYSHSYYVVIKCLKLDVVSGKLVYECQYVEDISKNDFITDRYKRDFDIPQGPIAIDNIDAVIQAMKIVPCYKLVTGFEGNRPEYSEHKVAEATENYWSSIPRQEVLKGIIPKETSVKKILYKKARMVTYEGALAKQLTKITMLYLDGVYKYDFIRTIFSPDGGILSKTPLTFDSKKELSDDLACAKFMDILEAIAPIDYSKSAFASLDNDDHMAYFMY